MTWLKMSIFIAEAFVVGAVDYRTKRSVSAACPGFAARARRRTSQVLRHLLAQDLAQRAFSDRLIGAGKIPSKRLVHHRLVAGPCLLGARPKFIEHGVVDEDRDARLALLRDDRAPLALRKVVFSSHNPCVPFALHDGPRSADTRHRARHRQPPIARLRFQSSLLGLSSLMYGSSLFPAAPIAGPASVMSKRDHSELFAPDIVNDAVGEFPQREAASAIPPRRAEVWVIAQKRQRSFVFQYKRQTHLGIGFAGVEESALG